LAGGASLCGTSGLACAGGEILQKQAAAFAALPARVLWKLTEKEQAELNAPGAPGLGTNIKACCQALSLGSRF